MLIRIPVVEGENKLRADRNRLSGKLEIPAHKLKRDLPAGSEVEITIEIDQSRLVKTQAYIPLLDEHFEKVISFKGKIPSQDQLRTEADREKQRLQEARDKARNVADPRARELLGRIDDERMEHDVDKSLAAARSDPDAAQKCQARLLDLRIVIDSIEDALEWPTLLAEAEEKIKEMQRIVREYGKSGDRQNAATLERETREAMKTHDTDKLRRKINEMSGLTFRMLREQPGCWVQLLAELVRLRATMRDPGMADQLINQVNRAIQSNNIEGLKAAVQQLLALMPENQRQKLTDGYGGSTIR